LGHNLTLHAVVRRGVRALLESQPGIEVCCEAATGLEAPEYVKKAKPNLVLLDLTTMPELHGLETARVIHDESPETDVLILTMHFSEDVAREVLRSGARGYVLKSDADAELVAAVRHVQQANPAPIIPSPAVRSPRANSKSCSCWPPENSAKRLPQQ
jgi:DNA-binding NarL/FixJ family response regulator